MHQCAVMVLPSLYEGFGIAFLEAMAVGLPVVGTPTGGMADLIEPGVNGLLVPHHEPEALAGAISALLSDPERRRALGRQARLTAQTYTWKRAAEATASVYRACVEDRVVPAADQTTGPRITVPEREAVLSDAAMGRSATP
jgi:glycogen(starch) synthase